MNTTFAALVWAAIPLSVACAQDVSFGDRLFHEKADCQFCHGANGDGFRPVSAQRMFRWNRGFCG